MPSSTPYFKVGKPSPREVSRSAGVQSWKGSAQAPGRSDSVSAPAPQGAPGQGVRGVHPAWEGPPNDRRVAHSKAFILVWSSSCIIKDFFFNRLIRHASSILGTI